MLPPPRRDPQMSSLVGGMSPIRVTVGTRVTNVSGAAVGAHVKPVTTVMSRVAGGHRVERAHRVWRVARALGATTARQRASCRPWHTWSRRLVHPGARPSSSPADERGAQPRYLHERWSLGEPGQPSKPSRGESTAGGAAIPVLRIPPTPRPRTRDPTLDEEAPAPRPRHGQDCSRRGKWARPAQPRLGPRETRRASQRIFRFLLTGFALVCEYCQTWVARCGA